MTGEELYRLGKECPAAAVCIPLNFIPTAPKLLYHNGWQAEFWYYMAQYHDQSIFAPQYRMVLRLPSAVPSEMRELTEVTVCIGSAPEMVTAAFYENQNRYLDQCVVMLEKEAPAAGELEQLEAVWRAVLPSRLAAWFEEGDTAPSDPFSPPENLREFWERELASAIQSDDTERIIKAQNELQKVVRNARSGI